MTTIQPNKRFFPRAAVMLLTVMLTATTAWAQTYYLTLEPNYEGAESGVVIPVEYDYINGGHHYSLSNFNPANYSQFSYSGFFITGWSETPTGPVVYDTDETVTLTGNMTLYAQWDGKTATIDNLMYYVINDNPREVRLYGNPGATGAVTIPASVTIDGCSFAVTEIAQSVFTMQTSVTSVTVPASMREIGNSAFYGCANLTSVTLNSNPKIGTTVFPAWTMVTMNLTANGPVDGDYWTTFYNDRYNFQADENTTVYKGTVSGSSLVLTEVEDKIVNSGTAVILKSTDKPVMTWVTTSSTDTHGNDLRGNARRWHRTDILTGSLAGGTLYVMGKVGDEFGFFEYTGEFMPVGKAYIALPPAEAPVRGLSMEENDSETTSIHNSQFIIHNEADAWHTLDGRRLNGMPTEKGVYVVNGKKVIIK